jgi:hypothetical protein
MVIDKVNEAAGYYVDKEFSPFCSPGCLLRSFETRRKQGHTPPDRLFFADYLGTGFQSSDSTFFLLTSHISSVMGWGVIGFADLDAALDHRKHDDESVMGWIGLRTQKGVPDRTIELVLTADGMSPDVVELAKDELIEWEIEGRGLDGGVNLRIRGYEEAGEVVVPASGDVVRFRLLATKPGTGFPFVRTDNGDVVGQVRVSGAHTAEEEDM